MSAAALITTAPQFADAQRQLRAVIEAVARERSRQLGFGWRIALDAPTTHSELISEFESCLRSGREYRVSGTHCHDTVYGSAHVNRAFRFWHDTHHATTGLTFAHEDEMVLAAQHLIAIERHGLDEDSLAYQLFSADTLGQAYFGARGHGFVGHQLRFALGVAAQGLHAGVEIEVRRKEDDDAKPS